MSYPSGPKDKRIFFQLIFFAGNLVDVAENLTKRQKEVIKLRYGTIDYEMGQLKFMSLKEIAKKLNLTTERIRQIEAKALIKMWFFARERRDND